MSSGPEYDLVERPFIEQLEALGWHHVTGSKDDATVTQREHFRQVLVLPRLRAALRRLNLDDNDREWLDESRIAQAIAALERLGPLKLIEANAQATERLILGPDVDGLPGWNQGRAQQVRYIDFDQPERNDFLVISQFRVDEPGGQAHGFIAPDLVLFVNGIPIVVVECKSPYVTEPIFEAIGQQLRYSNQRTWTEDHEGNERLFHTVQLMVAASRDKARVGTVGAQAPHYLAWKHAGSAPGPASVELSEQQVLVAGMLAPATLLDLVRNFTLFKTDTGKTIKVVARYQQYRAVQAAVKKLTSGKTRRVDGEHDRRGGIVWHTQGSGKSLTMVFLVRKMRTIPELRAFKVVVITDRKDLQIQLGETAALTGETVSVARNRRHLEELLRQEGPGLVFALIQKYSNREEEDDGGSASDAEIEFPELNTSDRILVMVDEAHRSHTSTAHANLMKALPNCAKIAFTGTPIIQVEKKQTTEIFGEFLDRYTIKQSEEDGSTVPILYEGRTAKAAVADGRDLDELFEDVFRERTPEERDAIQQKYATKGHILEAPKLIQAKARDMLRHYVDHVLPSGFKAQVVAHSRSAAIRYQAAFVVARDELVRDVEALDSGLLHITSDERDRQPRAVQMLLRAHPRLDLIRELEFAAVISGKHNDPGEYSAWTDAAKIKLRTDRFKKPLVHADPEKRDPLAFLIVKSMLLTGFDAPVEQVLYLDRLMKDHELLQAIARVNRTHGEHKRNGLIVDYCGIARHLQEALAAYNAEDVAGALRSLKDEIPTLADQHQRVLNVFDALGIVDLGAEEECVLALRDERVRAEFTVALKQFLGTLDTVLPRPEALPFVHDAKALGRIHVAARNRYRDAQLNVLDAGPKVRQLIDEHIVSLGIDPRIAPVTLGDERFEYEVRRLTSPRAMASEMEHALRHHLRQHFDEDPTRYQKLSERLEEILVTLKDHWDELVASLGSLREDVVGARKVDETGLDPVFRAPLYGLLVEARPAHEDLAPELRAVLIALAVDLADHIVDEIAVVGFWRNAHAQDVLRKSIVQRIDAANLIGLDEAEALADRVVELARANQARIHS